MRSLKHRVALILAVFTFLSPTILAAGQADIDTSKVTRAIMGDYERAASKEIQDFCADEWPTDYKMQNHCIEKNIESRAKAQQLGVMKSSENMTIWINCSAEWKDEKDRLNWVMMSHCIDEQSEALKKIKDRKD